MSPTLDVCEQNVGQLVCVGDAQVLEGLGRGVDFLVDQVSLHLVWVGLLPVNESLGVGNKLGKLQWHLVVGKVVRDGAHLGEVLRDTVDHLSDFQEGQLLAAVQLESLADGGVVVTDLLQTSGNVGDVHRVDLLGVSVRRPHLQLRAQVVQQVVLTAVHGSGSDDGGVGQDVSHQSLGNTLSGVVDGVRCWVGVVRRHVNISGVASFLHSVGDSLSDADVDVSHAEVLGGVVGTDTVVHDVGVGHGLGNGLQVSGVELNKVHHTQVTSDLQKSLLQLVSERDHDVGTVSGQLRGQVTTQEARGTKHSGSVSGSGGTATSSHGHIDLAVSGDVDVGLQHRGIEGSRFESPWQSFSQHDEARYWAEVEL